MWLFFISIWHQTVNIPDTAIFLPCIIGLNGGYQDELVDHRLTEREWADEWKHLDHVRNLNAQPPAPLNMGCTVSSVRWALTK